MPSATTAAGALRANRVSLGLSQSHLARLSGVSRFKICTYELGDGAISPDEQRRIREALRAEAERMRSITVQIEFGESEQSPVAGGSGD